MDAEAYLAERQAAAATARQREARDAVLRAWIWGKTPEQRLLKFDAWVKLELAARLDWTWAGPAQAKRLEQCRAQLETMLKHLFERGWHLDGRKLADLITAALDEVGAAQRAGRVKDFWPFFKSVISRYVGTHAEEIQAEALSAGNAVSQILEATLRGLPAKAPTVTELVAQRASETLHQKLARQRRQEARQKADAAQVQLF
jgi:valyl-tRNA synthetase